MLNSMKYSIIRALRDKEFMIMSILVAVVMGTVQYFMVGTMLEELEDGTLEIPVAVVEVAGNEDSMFIEILEIADLFELEFVDMEEALYKLETDAVDGIFEVGNEPRLIVINSGFAQLLMQTVADEYIIGGNILEQIATENPEYLETAIMSMMEPASIMNEMAIADDMADMMQLTAITFIIMTAVSGMFVGFERAIMTNNDGGCASRRITSSFGKMNILVADLIGVAFLVVAMTFAVWGYFALVLGVTLEMNAGFAILAFFLTALFSLSFGAFFGLVAPGKRKTREQILTTAYMVMVMAAFLGPQLQIDMLELINAINPISIVLDSIMALNLGSYTRYFGFMISIAIASIIFLALAIIALRRTRHVDIR